MNFDLKIIFLVLEIGVDFAFLSLKVLQLTADRSGVAIARSDEVEASFDPALTPDFFSITSSATIAGVNPVVSSIPRDWFNGLYRKFWGKLPQQLDRWRVSNNCSFRRPRNLYGGLL